MPRPSADMVRRRAILLGCGALSGLAPLAGPARAAAISLVETGSSLLYPLFNLWVAAYTAQNPAVRITTQSTGSGTGIAQAISGIVEIGATDAYMSNSEVRRNPGLLNIPLAISAQTINANLPSLDQTDLRLSGPLLAGIYQGHIRRWNDAAIARINPGVALPARPIIPIHRSDGSGDTFIFSQYLAFSTPSWAASVGYGTSLSWPPVAGGIGMLGNPGMVQVSGRTPGSLAYIGISFHAAIGKAGLGTALLQNRAGNFVRPDAETIGAAAAAMAGKSPPDARISLVFAPGANSYPLINYEYAIVNRRQPERQVAASLRDFLSWAIDPEGGSTRGFLNAVGFQPLPPGAAALARRQIAAIGT
ncbi:MAG: phosphate ABC transporter substrate-binding protein PstS [Acetobacteraceae bacterium]